MFDKILQLEGGPVSYEKVPKGNLRMKGHDVPLSIFQSEFDFIHNTVLENNLQRGFELATAFGISGLAAATAFKKTGGKLVTMDAYIEEKCGDAGTYRDFERTVYEKSDGYKSVKYLIEQFELQDTMIAEIGWSPDDVESIIIKNYQEKLDFVFLDAGHFSEQIIKDIDAIKPFLAEKFIFIFHDVYPWSFDETAQQHVEKLFGKRVEIVLPFPEGENMGILRMM